MNLIPVEYSVLYDKRKSSVGFSHEILHNEEQLDKILHPDDEKITQYLLSHYFIYFMHKWRTEVEYESSITKIIMNSSYLTIIGLGRKILPLILNELQKEPDHWHWALQAITGEDPVRPNEIGNMLAIRDAWLNWAREKGYMI